VNILLKHDKFKLTVAAAAAVGWSHVSSVTPTLHSASASNNTKTDIHHRRSAIELFCPVSDIGPIHVGLLIDGFLRKTRIFHRDLPMFNQKICG